MKNYLTRDIKIPAFYAAVFLISLATLIIEISLTRIFSVAIWYHFAFLVISIAMLGFAAAGAFLAVFPALLKKDTNKATALLAVMFAVTTLGSLLIISHTPLDPFKIINNPVYIINLFVFYVALTIPFMISGLCVVFLLSKMPDKVGGIYFCSLAGSGAGCLLVIFLIPLFSNVGAIIAAVLLILTAALMFNSNAYKKLNFVIIAMIILVCPLLVKSNGLIKFKIAESKGLSLLGLSGAGEHMFTRWNAFSQIDLVAAEGVHYAPGLSPKYSLDALPPQAMIFIDADAVTPITMCDKNPANMGFFKYTPYSIPYKLRKNANVCIIGAGGGYDVLNALSQGNALHVEAVEINPDISGIVTDYFSGFAGDIYRLPNVSLRNAEGRGFIRNSRVKYGIIQISLVDTWAAASLGAYSLTENYLYTTEAFADYINHLEDNGIVAVTRWMLVPPKETLRLVVLAVTALENIGVANPQDNIVLIQSGNVAVLLIKRVKFEAPEIKQIEGICKDSGFELIYAAGTGIKNIFYEFIQSSNRRLFYKSYPFNITPSTDDKPFYFHYYNGRHLNPFKFWELSSIDRNNISYLILLIALLQAVILSMVFILGPLYFAKRRGVIKKKTLKSPFFIYFSCLGMAFMFVEITLIQKFILFLGHPIYSLSIVLFSLLVFAGVGSLFSFGIKRCHLKRVQTVILALVILLLTYAFLLNKLSYIFIGWSLAWRCIITILLLAPLGVLMGFLFPEGVRLVETTEPELIPWLWGINGCFSVISSILSVILAMSFGFSFVLCLAAVLYLLALIAVKQDKNLDVVGK